MGFTTDSILSKSGALSKVWIAAHYEKRLTKEDVLGARIEDGVRQVIGGVADENQTEAPAPAGPSRKNAPVTARRSVSNVSVTLRLVSHLLVGLCKLYSRSARYLLEDCNAAIEKLRLAFLGWKEEVEKRQRGEDANAPKGGDGQPVAKKRRTAESGSAVFGGLDVLLADPAIRRAITGERLANIPGGEALLNIEPPLQSHIAARREEITLKDVIGLANTEAERKLIEALSQTQDLLEQIGAGSDAGEGDDWWSFDLAKEAGAQKGSSSDAIGAFVDAPDAPSEDGSRVLDPRRILAYATDDESLAGETAAGVHMDWHPEDIDGGDSEAGDVGPEFDLTGDLAEEIVASGTEVRDGMATPATSPQRAPLVDRAALDAFRTPKAPPAKNVVELAMQRAGLPTPQITPFRTVHGDQLRSSRGPNGQPLADPGSPLQQRQRAQSADDDEAIDFGWGDEDFRERRGIYDRPGTPELVRFQRELDKLEREQKKAQQSEQKPRLSGFVAPLPAKRTGPLMTVDDRISLTTAELKEWLNDTSPTMSNTDFSLPARGLRKDAARHGDAEESEFRSIWDPPAEFWLSDATGYTIRELEATFPAWTELVGRIKERQLRAIKSRTAEVREILSQASQRDSQKASQRGRDSQRSRDSQRRPKAVLPPADSASMDIDDGPQPWDDFADGGSLGGDDDGPLGPIVPSPNPQREPSGSQPKPVPAGGNLHAILLAQPLDTLFFSDVVPKTTRKEEASKLFHDLLVAATRGRGSVRVNQLEPYGEIEIEVVRERIEGMGIAGWQQIEREEEIATQKEVAERKRARATSNSLEEDLDFGDEDEAERRKNEEKRKGKRTIEGARFYREPEEGAPADGVAPARGVAPSTRVQPPKRTPKKGALAKPPKKKRRQESPEVDGDDGSDSDSEPVRTSTRKPRRRVVIETDSEEDLGSGSAGSAYEDGGASPKRKRGKGR